MAGGKRMKTIWQVRPAYFTKAGFYSFKVDNQQIMFAADRDGIFELLGEPPSGIGVFAKRIDGERKTFVI
jgi:hypothetical protein